MGKKVLDRALVFGTGASFYSLLETLFTYFEMNGNVSQTAEKLFIHRNTLQYRFRKIKEITGFDIYHIDDLVQLRLAVLQYRYFGI